MRLRCDQCGNYKTEGEICKGCQARTPKKVIEAELTEKLRGILPCNLSTMLHTLDCSPSVTYRLLQSLGAIQDGENWHLQPPINNEIEQKLAELEEALQNAHKADRLLISEQRKLKALDAKYRGALRELEHYSDLRGTIAQLGEIEPVQIAPMSGEGFKSEQVPVLMFSDWHPGCRVEKDEVNGLNEFNHIVFEQRIERLLHKAVKMIKIVSAGGPIKRLVIACLGDLIENYLHPENLTSNSISPLEEKRLVRNTLSSAIPFLLDELKLEAITVISVSGNHDRTTQKSQFNGAWKTSYSYDVIDDVASWLAKDSRITFNNSKGKVAYLDVLGHTLRFTHGDLIRYQGGVGGLHVPLMKWLSRQDATIKAAHTFLGHHHNYQPGSNYTVNGSIPGYSPYGAAHFSFERPIQGLDVFTESNGAVFRCPIYVDK